MQFETSGNSCHMFHNFGLYRFSFLHDMSNAEIAELLGMPRRTVEGHLYLALKFLRGRISAEELFALMLASIPMI